MKHRKKLLTSLFAVAGLLLAGSVWANGSGIGIAGSPHDFTDGQSSEAKGTVDETWNARGEICRVCHVPHDHQLATKRYTNGLLWNHGVSSATYTMYSSSTLNGTQSASPDGTAKLCLGCHDGTVAIDTFDKYDGTAERVIQSIYAGAVAAFRVPSYMDGANLDLRGTHPISISYNNTADTNLRPTTTAMGTSGTTIADVLDNNKVQCSSCHDVHDQESIAGTHLLRVAQTVKQGGPASGLCLPCHIK